MTPDAHRPSPDPATLANRRAREAVEDLVDETSLDSFPASDPPAWTGVQVGRAHAPVPELAEHRDVAAAGHGEALRQEFGVAAPIGVPDDLQVPPHGDPLAPRLPGRDTLREEGDAGNRAP